VANTPEQFTQVIKDEIATYAKIVKQYNIKAD
jgi:tripartite-type tricarboxylate transporter receptor subunit TctC